MPVACFVNITHQNLLLATQMGLLVQEYWKEESADADIQPFYSIGDIHLFFEWLANRLLPLKTGTKAFVKAQQYIAKLAVFQGYTTWNPRQDEHMHRLKVSIQHRQSAQTIIIRPATNRNRFALTQPQVSRLVEEFAWHRSCADDGILLQQFVSTQIQTLKRPGNLLDTCRVNVKLTDPEEEILASVFGTVRYSEIGTAGAFHKLRSDADNFGYEIGTYFEAPPGGNSVMFTYSGNLQTSDTRLNLTSLSNSNLKGFILPTWMSALDNGNALYYSTGQSTPLALQPTLGGVVAGVFSDGLNFDYLLADPGQRVDGVAAGANVATDVSGLFAPLFPGKLGMPSVGNFPQGHNTLPVYCYRVLDDSTYHEAVYQLVSQGNTLMRYNGPNTDVGGTITKVSLLTNNIFLDDVHSREVSGGMHKKLYTQTQQQPWLHQFCRTD